MNKQIKLLEDGRVQFRNGRIEQPKNEVYKIDKDTVYFFLNRHRYLAKMNAEDYFKHSFWATRLTYDHAGRNGVVSYHTGLEHKSVAATIYGSRRGQKVRYKDRNKFNLCRANLVVASA